MPHNISLVTLLRQTTFLRLAWWSGNFLVCSSVLWLNQCMSHGMQHWLRIWVWLDFVNSSIWWPSLSSLGLELLIWEWSSNTANCWKDWWMHSMLSKLSKHIGIVFVPWLEMLQLFWQKMLWTVVPCNWDGNQLGWLKLRTTLAGRLFQPQNMVQSEHLFGQWTTILRLLAFLCLPFVDRLKRKKRAWRPIHQPEFEGEPSLQGQLFMPIKQQMWILRWILLQILLWWILPWVLLWILLWWILLLQLSLLLNLCLLILKFQRQQLQQFLKLKHLLVLKCHQVLKELLLMLQQKKYQQLRKLKHHRLFRRNFSHEGQMWNCVHFVSAQMFLMKSTGRWSKWIAFIHGIAIVFKNGWTLVILLLNTLVLWDVILD